MSFYLTSHCLLHEARMSPTDIVARLRQSPGDSDLRAELVAAVRRGFDPSRSGLSADDLWYALSRHPGVRDSLSRFVGRYGVPRDRGESVRTRYHGLDDLSQSYLGILSIADAEFFDVPVPEGDGTYALASDIRIYFEYNDTQIAGSAEVYVSLDLGSSPASIRIDLDARAPFEIPEEDEWSFESPAEPLAFSRILEESYQTLRRWASIWDRSPERGEED